MADPFDLVDLAAYMQQDLDTATATIARRVASGWLRSATGLSDWPSPVPDDLWTWALELAEMAYGNPAGLAAEGIDDYSSTFDRARRMAILDTARAKYSVGGVPQYSFPDPDWHWDTAVATVLPD